MTIAFAFVAGLQALAARLPIEIDRAMDAARTEGVALLQVTTSFRDRTGNLRASFASLSPLGRMPFSRQVGSEVEYGRFLEFGTRSISPRRFVRDAGAALEASLHGRIEQAIASIL